MPSIDNNIIQSLGAGSGIDSKNIVKQLTEIERSGPQGRIDAARDKAESQISDFGLLSSAMATLSDAAKVLSDPEGLFSKSAAFTESNALVPVDLSTDVQTGSYEFEVLAIAKSQSISSGSFTNTTDAVGEGTLTFDFGSSTVDGFGKLTAFNADLSATSFTVTIDSSNNTLTGLRDAINKADFGVQATIVNDGSGYILQINAESGALNEMQITVGEAGGAPSNEDDADLSRFSFVAGVGSQMTQNQAGQDASIKINGLLVSRETNTIDDIVSGLTLNVLKPDPGVPVTITITDDKTFAEQGIRDFVEAYNLFLDAIKPAIGTYEKEDAEGKKQTLIGSLAKDSLAKSVVSRIRSVFGGAVPGLTNTLFTSLGTAGIQTNTDGSLSIDEKKFKESMDTHFSDIQKLFAPQKVSSDSGITVNSYGAKTAPGAYDVVITTQPAKSQYQGQIVAVPLTTVEDHTFTINVNGKTSAALTLPNATYSSNADIAKALQKLINEDATLAAANASVTVAYNTTDNRFDITSTAYGVASNVEITSASSFAESELGLTVAAAARAGASVAGTINGVAGFGTGNVLLPALGQPGESLAMIIGDNATSATVNFSRGFASELQSTLSVFLASSGLIDKHEEVLKKTISKAETDEKALDIKMTAYQDRLMNQFIAMERILNGLNSSGGFLENLVDTLPFTAKQ